MKNNEDKKPVIKVSTLLKIVYIIIVAMIICFVLKGRTDEILSELKNLSIYTVMGLILCSVFFNVTEGISYYLMGKRSNSNIRPVHGIGCSYYCAFFKLSTLGSGTAAAGMVYLNKYKVDPSKSFGMITVNYIIQKLAVVILCLVGFIYHYNDMEQYYHKYFNYIVLGVVVTILLAVGLLLVILWKKFHRFIIYLTNKIIRKEEHRKRADRFKQQLLSVSDESYKMLKEKTFLLKLLILNMVKFLGWYMIPCVILEYDNINNILLGLSISALASALIGVIPSPGATGSTEAMYYMLFAVITQDSKATAIMLLYRCFTYIFPFLTGMIMIMYQRFCASWDYDSTL